MTNINDLPTGYTLHDMEGVPLAEADVRLLGEGDLLVGLRPKGAHPDAEQAIITVEARANGSFLIRLMDGDTNLLAEQVIEAPRPVWATECFDSAGTLAVKKDGIDVLHMHTVEPDREFTDVTLSEGEHQMVIDAVDRAISGLNTIG